MAGMTPGQWMVARPKYGGAKLILGNNGDTRIATVRDNLPLDEANWQVRPIPSLGTIKVLLASDEERDVWITSFNALKKAGAGNDYSALQADGAVRAYRERL